LIGQGAVIAGCTLAGITRESQDSTWKISESRHQVIWLVLFILAILLLGILPQWRWIGQSAPSIITGLLIP
jgi:hypothetical protein